jgi:hypothetical protein
MKTIAHQAVGANLPLRLAAGLAQATQKQPALARAAKDRFPAVPSRLITRWVAPKKIRLESSFSH